MKSNGHSEESFRLLSFNEVIHMTGLSRSTIYRQIKSGDFPRPRTIAKRKIGFLDKDLEHWFEARDFAEGAAEQP